MKSLAATPEDQSFSSAWKLFEDGQFNLAETNFNNFLSSFTNSGHQADAILYLARSRLEQSNYVGAIALLEKSVPQSGDLMADYIFWIAKARLAKGDYALAARGFSNLIRHFPTSRWPLEAAYDEADAYAKLEDWPRVVHLLRDPDSAFRTVVAADPRNENVAAGSLLLGQALFALGNFADGEKVVQDVDTVTLAPELQWRREYILCRCELAQGLADQALQSSTNLLDAAFGPRHRAASRFLRGEILEVLGRPAEALQFYTNNLADDLPAEVQRQALLKTVELTQSQNQLGDTLQLLQGYIAQRPHGPAMDLARLSLGELYLKLYFNPSPVESTNSTALLGADFLQGALTNFDSVIHDFPASPLLAKAHLDRGWCYWTAKKMDDARADFQEAAEHLPFSTDEAVARFKLADLQFYQHDYGAAVTNYNLLLKQYAGTASVTNTLFDHALYQLAEASLDRGDREGARIAVNNILIWYPNSYFGAGGLLLIGEDRKNDYAMARQVFGDLLKRYPDTPLLPEVEYAIARTFEQEGNWPMALAAYNRWVGQYQKNPLLPRVEFSRALAYERSGLETNALIMFSNFVARFPSNSFAPWAQNAVADYYFNHEDYPSAEKNYELLYQTFPNAGDVSYQAILWAGRAALAGQRIDEARKYFLSLVNDTNAPPNLARQGWFAFGDTALMQFQGSPNNETNMDDAIAAFSHLTNGAPTNAVAVQALGRLGDCYMQWADLRHDPKVFVNVIQMYQAILSYPETNTDIATRSQAEVGLGLIAERQGHNAEALDDYCKVLYDLDPENFDPFWVEQAGVYAAHLCEEQHQWEKAVNVYKRILEAVPSLRAALDKKIASAQSHAEEARN
jgi:tetratricopeptide (TPR) repeat protein